MDIAQEDLPDNSNGIGQDEPREDAEQELRSLPDEIIDEITKVNETVKQMGILENDIKALERKTGKLNRQNTKLGWTAARALSKMRKVLKPQRLWGQALSMLLE